MVINVPPDNQFIAVLEQGSFYFFGALILAFVGAIRLINSHRSHSRLLAVAGLGMLINGISAVPFVYPASFIYWLLVGQHLDHLAQPEMDDPEEESP
jgi:hypothetical protein